MNLIGLLPVRWQPYWDVNGDLTIDPDAEWQKRQDSHKGINGLVDLLRDMLYWSRKLDLLNTGALTLNTINVTIPSWLLTRGRLPHHNNISFTFFLGSSYKRL